MKRFFYQRSLTIDPVESPAMKIPRLRFTVRRLMVAVSLAAVALGCVAQIRDQARRSAHRDLLRKEAFYAARERGVKMMVADCLHRAATAADPRSAEAWKAEAAGLAKEAAAHGRERERLARLLRRVTDRN